MRCNAMQCDAMQQRNKPSWRPYCCQRTIWYSRSLPFLGGFRYAGWRVTFSRMWCASCVNLSLANG